MEDGTVEDVTVEDGTVNDGTVNDGTVEDVTVEDGTVNDGTVEDGGCGCAICCAKVISVAAIAGLARSALKLVRSMLHSINETLDDKMVIRYI